MGFLKIKDFDLLMSILEKKTADFRRLGEDKVRIWAHQSIIDLLLLENQRKTLMRVKFKEGESTLFGVKLLPIPTEDIYVGFLYGGYEKLPMDQLLNVAISSSINVR